MPRTIYLIACLVYGAALVGAAVAARSASAGRADLPRAGGAADRLDVRRRGPLVGCAINLHHTEQLDQYLTAVDELVDEVGFTSIEVITPAYMTNGQSDDIRIVHGPGLCPDRDQLLALLRHARARGARTMLMPVVLLSDPGRGEWRGKIQPQSWRRWWRSYERTMDYFLDIAKTAGVDIFCVGSELLSTERQTDRWNRLIRHVRGRYKGLLTYSTNWDHYHVPAFWEKLDLIGMNGYWDLTKLSQNPQDPAFEDLTRRWIQIRRQVLAHANKFKRPLLFTEVGYPSLPWGLKDPWNYVNDKHAVSDPNTQARGYSVFLSAWDNLLNEPPADERKVVRFAGVFFYRWDPYVSGGPNDTGYGIRGKTTIELIKSFLERRRRIRTRNP